MEALFPLLFVIAFCLIAFTIAVLPAAIAIQRGHVGLGVLFLCVDNGGFVFWYVIGTRTDFSLVILVAAAGVCGFLLIGALCLSDLNSKQVISGEAAFWREERERHQFLATPHALRGPQAAVPSQVRCPRCGSMNASELVACWHCELELDSPEPVAPAPVRLPNVSRPATRTSAKPAKRVTRATKKSSQPATIQRPAGEVPSEIRVECNACSKRFAGLESAIRRMAKCPKCAATPFTFKVLPAK
jgi:hypothetical protein